MRRGDSVWASVLAVITLFLFIPFTHNLFVGATKTCPYIMGFIKFAILASMGELLAVRITTKTWRAPAGMPFRTLIWGVLGAVTTLMFGVFSSGVTGMIAAGMLDVGTTFPGLFTAFYISAIMNLAFAPAFMGLHRMTDTYIDLVCEGGQAGLTKVIARIDWDGFIKFVILKTVPFFWIPAHTLVFLLPPEYRILAAAFLSIALGAILAYAKR